jgi:hypothetical protein
MSAHREHNTAVIFPNILEDKYFRKFSKKRAGREPCSKNCVDPISPKNLDLILVDGATLLVRARAPPETWTTRLQPCGQPEPLLLDHLFRLVIIFSNDCSKFGQFT